MLFKLGEVLPEIVLYEAFLEFVPGYIIRVMVLKPNTYV